MSLKIIFAGTPDFAVPSLKKLHATYDVIAVYTQPDRAKGRGKKVIESVVKQCAKELSISVYQPKSLRNIDAREELQALNADLMVVVAYGLILPLEILQAPRYGCINVHGSILPAWRGAAPVQRAILNGDSQTGVTIMQMDEGLDTGDMLDKAYCEVGTKNAHELRNELAILGAVTLSTTLIDLENNNLSPIKQNEDDASYAHKLSKQDGLIDWTQSAIQIERKVRAFNDWPMAFSYLDENYIRISEAVVVSSSHSSQAGMIIKADGDGIDIACGEDVLRIKVLQLEGAKFMLVKDCMNSRADLFTYGKIMKNARS